jgi:phage tail-like protein
MSAQKACAYRFATEAQWSACLFESAERFTKDGASGIRPPALYGARPERYETAGAGAPVEVGMGEIWWHDDAGQLYRLPADFSQPQATPAPGALGSAPRIVATSSGLWVAGIAPESLQCFDAETCTRRLAIDLAPARVLDLAADGRGGLFVLLERGAAWECVRVDRAGHIAETFTLAGIAGPKQLAYLRRNDRIVVLAEEGTRLHWFARGSERPERRTALNWPRPCFTADWLASDGRTRIVVAGTDRADFGGEPHALVFDGEGHFLQDLALKAPATGLAVARDALLVATAGGLLRHRLGDTVPDEVPEARCALMTPMLTAQGADRLRRWLRVEARAALPSGATLEVSYAATEDQEVLKQAARIARDASFSASERVQKLRAYLTGWKSLALQGSDATAVLSDQSVPLSVPLHEAHDSHLWLYVTLSAAPGGRIPELFALEVLYAAPTLMDHLPAIYRRQEAEPGNFLRALVGVLEATTQTLDARIAAMGAKANPASAPPDWLDFTARWVGLPWSDSLDEMQKRALAQHAAAIAAGRGTRAGLETLLECLLPGEPYRHRVTDVSVDFGLATPGGAKCRGSAIPAVLGGLPRSALVLGRRAELGRGRLPCTGEKEDDGGSRLLGYVRVDVAAGAEERRAWEPWLPALLNAMAPVTARIRLRWLAPGALRRRDVLDGTLTLEDRPAPHLGTDAVLDLARLPADSPLGLSTSLDSNSRLH